jgi:hypothetical protein
MIKSSSLIMAAALVIAANAFADDSPTDEPVKSPKQRMQACMAKQQQANPSASKDDLKKRCAQLTQSKDQHPSVPPSQTPPSP